MGLKWHWIWRKDSSIVLFLFIHYAFVIENSMSVAICFHKNFISTDVGSGPLRAERRRREARREIFTTPGHVTARRSILGPPAEGRPGPSWSKLTRRSMPLQHLAMQVFGSTSFYILTLTWEQVVLSLKWILENGEMTSWEPSFQCFLLQCFLCNVFFAMFSL